MIAEPTIHSHASSISGSPSRMTFTRWRGAPLSSTTMVVSPAASAASLAASFAACLASRAASLASSRASRAACLASSMASLMTSRETTPGGRWISMPCSPADAEAAGADAADAEDAGALAAAALRGRMRTPCSSTVMSTPWSGLPGSGFSIFTTGSRGGLGAFGTLVARGAGISVTVSLNFHVNGGSDCTMAVRISSSTDSRMKRIHVMPTSQLA